MKMSEKKAVMIGAGNIGRGFIGQIFHDSGYEVVFIDINTVVIDKLNKDKAYNLILTDGENKETHIIDNVRAINGKDSVLVVQELVECDIAATAVGKNALRFVVQNLANGIKERNKQRSDCPLNLLICENIHNARDFLYNLLLPFFSSNERPILDAVGLVETTIGRMVPVPTDEMRTKDPTAILAEPYCRIPVNTRAFKGEPPKLLYTESFEPFQFFEEKKLYIHNLGHAICAYLGSLRGHKYIWQAAEDPVVRGITQTAMGRVADAIAEAYNYDCNELHDFTGVLLRRFCNRMLEDTVSRVGQDPLRKLAAGDRIMGAIDRCKAQGIPYDELLLGMTAALRFYNKGDPSAALMQQMLTEKGVQGFLSEYCTLSAEDIRVVDMLYKAIDLVHAA
jgi:mannitol-1-phosphate 5-dehydrogenase